jgi:hypothetical protein
MVLPGAQALLGFQFVTLVLREFEKLPHALQVAHVVSLGFMALAVILLMTPAAYHRVVEEGENSEEFHRFASRMLLASLVPLVLGIAGDFYLVVWKVAQSDFWAGVMTAVLVVFSYGAWFGLPMYRKWTDRELKRA